MNTTLEQAEQEVGRLDKTLHSLADAVAAVCAEMERLRAENARLRRADIPTIIRRSTWRTPELRESAARLVSNILRTDEDKALGPPVPPDHFPVA